MIYRIYEYENDDGLYCKGLNNHVGVIESIDGWGGTIIGTSEARRCFLRLVELMVPFAGRAGDVGQLGFDLEPSFELFDVVLVVFFRTVPVSLVGG